MQDSYHLTASSCKTITLSPPLPCTHLYIEIKKLVARLALCYGSTVVVLVKASRFSVRYCSCSQYTSEEHSCKIIYHSTNWGC